MRPVFADNSSRRTVNFFDEAYPTICQSHEIRYKPKYFTDPATVLSLETLYDGLDSSDDTDSGGAHGKPAAARQNPVEDDVKVKLGSKKQDGTQNQAAKAINDLNGDTKQRRGRPRKTMDAEVADLKTKAKQGVKKSKKTAKRVKREASESVELERTNKSRELTMNSRGEIDTDTDELTKERMDEEDKQVYKEVMEKMRGWENKKKNKSASVAAFMGRTWFTKKRRKPTYSYSSKDEEEAERKWEEQAKRKGRYMDSKMSIDPDDSPPHNRRQARSLNEDIDLESMKREIDAGRTVVYTTNENSTPPYEYFQEKVYPSHNLTSAQLNDESFCRELIPELEKDNKFLMAELRRRATEQAEIVRKAQGENELSEINEDESFEMGLKSRETTATTPMTSARQRIHGVENLDDSILNETIVKRRKRAVNLTDEEYRAQLQRNLEVYGLIDEWKEKQVELAMVASKERYLLNQIDELRNKMNMSHGQDDPYYKAAVTEAIKRENQEAKLYEKEINEWWSKERKERRAYEKEHLAKYTNQSQAQHDQHENEEEAMKQAQLKDVKEKHEKEMAEREAKGLPPDDYEQMLPIAKGEMEEDQKKYEEECKNCPKTLDEFQREFDGDVDLDQLRKNLEVYDLIEKWKKRQAQKEKEQAVTRKTRKRREVDTKLRRFQNNMVPRSYKNSWRTKRDINARATMLQREERQSDHNSILHNILAKVLRKKRAVNLTNEEYREQLQRNLEVYGLIDEWKEKQVELAMVASKERYLLNQIDELRNKMNMSHGQDDPYYKAAVTEAIKRENQEAKLYEKEINEWWSKERKERRAYEKEHLAKYTNQSQAQHDQHENEEEAMKQAQLKDVKEKHEKEMAEREAKGLPPDDYEQMLPIAKGEMEEDQKKYEEECKNCPKTLDEFQREFDGDVDLDQLRKNLEVYDLIEKWKKRQAQKEKEQAVTQKSRKRRDVDIRLNIFQKSMNRFCPLHHKSFRSKREIQGIHQKQIFDKDEVISDLAKVLRSKRAVNLTDEEYRAQLQRNLEVYGLIDEWKEKQVELAMVASKERYLLNQIDELRNKMNMSHGQDDPYYKAAVTEAIKRENQEAKLYEKEINEWWSKERKERRAYEKEHLAKYTNQSQAQHDQHENEEEAMKQAQLKDVKEKHEKEMAEREAKGLPPDDYEQMLPIAKGEMEEDQKKYEEECKNCPKTLDEFQREFDGDVDLDQLRKNLEVYDLIEKWKKRQAQKEKEQAATEKTRKRREAAVVNVLKRLKRRSGRDSHGEYVDDMSRYHEGKRIHQQLDHDMKKYKDQGESDGAMSEVCRDVMQKNNKFDQPDYRRKRDINANPKRKDTFSVLNSKTILNIIKQNLELLKERKTNKVKRPNVIHKNNLEVEDFNIVRHGNTSIYEYVYQDSQEATTVTQGKSKQKKAQDEFITDSVSGVSEERITGESSTQEQAEYKKKHPNRIMCCKDSLEVQIHQMRKEKDAKLRRVRRAVSNNNTIDVDNKEFNKQLDAMVEEHARKQKLFTGTTKKRPTAASEFPTKDDFVPFNRFSSAELRKFDQEDNERNRFAYFKAVSELMGLSTTPSDSDEYDSFAKELLAKTKTTTIATSTKSPEERSRDKIQNLKTYIKTKLEDTAKKFSDALQFLDKTTTKTSSSVTSESESTTHITDYYKLTYPPNPDDLLHKKDVTFAFGESKVETTTPEVLTFSPLYTFIQHYNKYEDDPQVKEPTVIFSLTHPDEDTYSPMYNFHRYYHTLNDSLDPRNTETTKYAFERKDPSDLFTLPTFEPEATVYVYDRFKTTHETTSADTTATKESLKPEGKPTTRDIEAGISDELSDMRKFKPPNMEEIKKYIDSVTRPHEKFCKENFEWDSENSAYTLIEEEATTPTLSPKQREEDRAFIEALQRDGIRPSTAKPLEKETTKTSENREETTVHQKEFNSFLKSLLGEHSKDTYPKQDAQLIKNLINIFDNNTIAQAQQTTTDKNRLKKTLQNVLHKYSEEVLKNENISNGTRNKFMKMKNMVRVLLENFVPNQKLDWEPLDKSLLDTHEKQRKFTDPEDYPINLRKQLNQALKNFSDENESHQKRLKTMVRRVLHNSFEHMHSSEVADEPIFTEPEDVDEEVYDMYNDVCTDRRFKTNFRLGLKNLLHKYSKTVLNKNKDLTSREKRVNRNMFNILRTAVESYSFGPEADGLAAQGFFEKLSTEEKVTRKVTVDPKADIKKDLRAQVEHYMKTYRETGHEDSLEKDTNGKLKKLVRELLEDNSFEYTNSDIMEGNVKRLRTEPEPETEPTVTVLNTEERQEVEAERKLRTPTYDYYDSNEEILFHKHPSSSHKTTIDYYELYKEKVTELRTTTLSESHQARNEKFFRNMDNMERNVDQLVKEHEKKVLERGPTPKTSPITTRDSMETDETSEEEPITYRTMGPTVPRIEMDFSDSRQFEIPFYGITVTKSTMHSNERYYTPGQGFENRSTVPHSDEWRRARMSFRYDLANPVLANATNVHVIGVDMLLPPTTTVDYAAFYRRRMRKTTTQEPIPTKDSAQRAQDRDKFLAHQKAFEAHINETVFKHAADPAQLDRVNKVRPVETTPNSELTEELSEEEPMTYRTQGPTVPRIEMEFSDSREYVVPILGITLTTGTRLYYTPGEGFENRTTIPFENEYERAKWRFKYDPWVEIDRQMMEDAAKAGQTTPLSRKQEKRQTSTAESPAAGKSKNKIPPNTGGDGGGLFDIWKRKWFRSDLYNKTVGHWNRVMGGDGSKPWRSKVDTLLRNVDKKAHRLMHVLLKDKAKHADCSAADER
ncbi:hypothetical protein WDU94_000479 [Cyamophila willieti]